MNEPDIPLKVQRTDRLVIQNQLLAALDNKTKVAILCTKEDIDLLIVGLEGYEGPQDWRKKCLLFATDLRKLEKEAFGR